MTEFTKQIKAKGWKMKDVADRWGLTPRQMSNISAKPKKRDWDAVEGLPDPQNIKGETA